MWYLIIPPIIVVLGLALLLWYLSRKGSDPQVRQKMADAPPLPKKERFLRTKNFFLRLLEKLTQKFKVRSLKMHNTMGGLAQSIKKRRQRVIEQTNLRQNVSVEAIAQEPPPKRPFWQRFRRKETEEAPAENVSPADQGSEDFSALNEPLLRRSKRAAVAWVERTRPLSSHLPTPETEPRPMVSDEVTKPEPEIRRKRTRQNVPHEEELIESIAENPKDFTAYEALGDYYMSVNNIRDAKECYRQVLKLRPVHRLVKIKIRRLEKIIAEEKAS